MEGLTLKAMAHDLTHIVLCLVAIVVLLGLLNFIVGMISEHFQAMSKKAQTRLINARKRALWNQLQELNMYCHREFPQVSFMARHLQNIVDKDYSLDAFDLRERLRQGEHNEPLMPENINDHEGEVK